MTKQRFTYAVYAKPVISDGVDGLTELEVQAKPYYEPQSRRQQLEAAGLEFIAENYDALSAFSAADERFKPIEHIDYERYRVYFNHITPLKTYGEVPPDEVIAALAAARGSKLFTELAVHRHRGTGETVVIGSIDTPLGDRQYLIAQWGEVAQLMTPEALQKALRPSRAPQGFMALLMAASHASYFVGVSRGWIVIVVMLVTMAGMAALESARATARQVEAALKIGLISFFLAFVLWVLL